ncbi:hypothetical protein [Pseudomonas izuensis]|nr:hypothetical protein [Pseudomonas izuensis]
MEMKFFFTADGFSANETKRAALRSFAGKPALAERGLLAMTLFQMANA